MVRRVSASEAGYIMLLQPSSSHCRKYLAKSEHVPCETYSFGDRRSY